MALCHPTQQCQPVTVPLHLPGHKTDYQINAPLPKLGAAAAGVALAATAVGVVLVAAAAVLAAAAAVLAAAAAAVVLAPYFGYLVDAAVGPGPAVPTAPPHLRLPRHKTGYHRLPNKGCFLT